MRQYYGKTQGELAAKYAKCADLSEAYIQGEPKTRTEASLQIKFERSEIL